MWIGPRGGYNYQGNLAGIIAYAGNGSAAGGSIDVADQRICLVVDPMLATGGSATAAIDYLRAQGCLLYTSRCV